MVKLLVAVFAEKIDQLVLAGLIDKGRFFVFSFVKAGQIFPFIDHQPVFPTRSNGKPQQPSV